MTCQNCKKQITEEAVFCPNCGADLRQQNVLKQEISHNTKKSFSKVIIIIVILALIIGVSFAGVNYFKNKEKKTTPDNKPIDVIPNNKDENDSDDLLNSIEKLKRDYNSGILSANDYFTQLVYLEYDSSKMDKKYVLNNSSFITPDQLDTDEILEANYDKLDKEIVKYYLTNAMLLNVKLGEESSIIQQSNDNSDYKVVPLTDNSQYVSSHRLNKVKVSRNNNFLIWYTNTGNDAITEEQLASIADGLEDSVYEYEKIFGIDYSYDPYVDNKYFNDDYDIAEEILSKNNISKDILKKAMSVYVYDTGSEDIAASYRDEEDGKKLISRTILFDLLGEDGIINYPYIVINKRAIVKNNESLIQLYNHELFHHMQYLFCKSINDNRCAGNVLITEGMANFASSKVSKSTAESNFLNEWAGIYVKNTSTKLENIVNYADNQGYALFLYYDAYSNNVYNWKEILMNAHTKQAPLRYIKENTAKADLINTINDLAYRTLSQDYNNKALLSTEGIVYKQELKNNKKYDLRVNAGAIDYFVLNNNSNINISTNGNDYLTIKVYGYKNGIYNEIISSNESVELDTAFFMNYEKIYLAVTNGDLSESYDYSIDLITSKVIENSEYDTSFNNYNITITMNTKVSGIAVEQHATGVVDELHQKEYLNFDTTTMGITLSNKIYYDFNSGYTYMTQPYGGDVWWRESGTSQLVDLKAILNRLINMKDVTKISDNHYRVKMTKNDIEEIMKSAKSNASSIKGDIYVDVYTENGYIRKLEYDFTKLVSEFDLFTTTINISNYNNAGDVEIPEVIVKNAKNK